jgi:hypothetical protein
MLTIKDSFELSFVIIIVITIVKIIGFHDCGGCFAIGCACGHAFFK